MTINTEAHFPCPNCGGPAHLWAEWQIGDDGLPTEPKITRFSCPNDCQVSEQSLKQILGVGGEIS